VKRYLKFSNSSSSLELDKKNKSWLSARRLTEAMALLSQKEKKKKKSKLTSG